MYMNGERGMKEKRRLGRIIVLARARGLQAIANMAQA